MAAAPPGLRLGGTRTPAVPGPDAEDPELRILGLRAGEAIRWQSSAGGRWRPGTVTRRERDGSIGFVNGSGAARSLPVERLQVRNRGPRGGLGWEPLADRAGRAEQLCLLELEPLPGASPVRPGRSGRLGRSG